MVIQAREDFKEISRRWPGVLITWSATVPRCTWWATLSVSQADCARRNANREIRKALVSGLGQYVAHLKSWEDEIHFYRNDGVHLSEEGMDFFISDLQQGLRSALGLSVGASA